MSCPPAQIRLTPITSASGLRNPRILLSGDSASGWLKYLEGWPRRLGGPHSLSIEQVTDSAALAGYASDSFDLAVVQSPPVAELPEWLGELLRVARQGLIIRRRA